MKRFFSSFLWALSFLTRVPAAPPGEIDGEAYAGSIALYGWVGAMIGAVLYGADALWRSLGLAYSVRAFFALALWLGITGAMHVDGWSDTADGFFSNRSRERILKIMRDPHVGSFGMTAVVLLLLGKWVFLERVLDRCPLALMAVPAYGRAMASFAISRYPVARPGGMGDHLHRRVLPAQTAVSNILLLFASFVYPLWLGAFAGCAIFGFWMIRRSMQRIGGLTGDVYGALVEGGELFGLMALGVLL